MSCDFEEKLSLLMDGALSTLEATAVRQHIETCEACRLIERDFLHLGRAIRELEPAISTEAALGAVLSDARAGFWRGRVAVPLPLVAAAVLALAALGAWAALGELSGPGGARPAGAMLQARPPSTEPVGLDRFDRGQPPRLYKVPRDDR